MKKPHHKAYQKFIKAPQALISSSLLVVFVFFGIYAPFLCSSKPLFVIWEQQYYFPLFRYLLSHSFFSSKLDLFFNALALSLPIVLFPLPKKKWLFLILQMSLFFFAISHTKDPASDGELNKRKNQALLAKIEQGLTGLEWQEELTFLPPYAKLHLVLEEKRKKKQALQIEQTAKDFPKKTGKVWPSLWHKAQEREAKQLLELEETLAKNPQEKNAAFKIRYLKERRAWLEAKTREISYQVDARLSAFHWEEDAGGSQSLNPHLKWWQRTRINRKDLLSALVFGIRISLFVGFSAVFLALCIAIPIGSICGYYGGYLDMLLFRLLEIWESMPTLFVLLLLVSILQSKSIFLIIAVLGLFGWTGFCRFLRAETLRQRNLPYVNACKAMGFSDRFIIFSHVLPNALPPLWTLLPFALMSAISSEAGLSFLGLGQEGSCSWGGLMDEGRSAFPAESYLLWPPGILLTLLLVFIAILGDALRDAFDPKSS